MTRKEAERLTHQESALLALGFTREEAEQLRRISMTLHRWHELECGTDSYAIVRGHWDKGKAEFVYDEDRGTDAPHYEFANGSGRSRYQRIPDRETGAKRRLRAIVEARNERINGVGNFGPKLTTYIQTDPRGAALYVIRPGDVPEGSDVASYYTRGVCIY